MKELMRTNDAVLLSYLRALFADAGINYVIADGNMSIVEGSLGILPRRVLVADEHLLQAQRLLKDAGVEGGAGP